MAAIGAAARRARRLTDTTDQPSSKQQLTSRGSGGFGIGASSGGTEDEWLSNVTCYGGGLETNRTANVGAIKVTYSVNTAPGSDPGGNVKDNQDSWAIKERLGGQDLMLFGVFDGHGAEGKAVSHTITTKLPKLLANSLHLKPATLDAALLATFPEANRQLKRSAIDCDLSGSTGVVALLTGGSTSKLTVANLGDSRCVLGKVDAHGDVSTVPLTSDHTPMDAQEAARINATGGRIASFMYGDEPLGPPRVWLKDVNVPGLCMTRSFGDCVAASVGVIDVPEVVACSLKPEDRYLILMSDGIFEFMDSQEVVQAVHDAAERGVGPNENAKRLVREARKRWQEEEDDIIDDCTAMVIYLAPVSSAASVSSVTSKLESSLKLKGGSTGSKASNLPPGTLGYKSSSTSNR